MVSVPLVFMLVHISVIVVIIIDSGNKCDSDNNIAKRYWYKTAVKYMDQYLPFLVLYDDKEQDIKDHEIVFRNVERIMRHAFLFSNTMKFEQFIQILANISESDI